MPPPALVCSRPARRSSWLVGALVATVAVVVGTPVPAPASPAEPEGVWPLQPRPEVVRGFDPPDVRWGSGHRGVDLAGHVGQPVRAAVAGTVSFAGRVAGRGVVVVDHGATRTTYEPVTATVGRGDPVGRGGVLGTLAWFGTHCLPAACLHWGLLRGDTYLDPLSLVGAPQPVRLLPLAGRSVLSPRLTGAVGTSGPVTAVVAGPALVAVAGATVGEAAGG